MLKEKTTVYNEAGFAIESRQIGDQGNRRWVVLARCGAAGCGAEGVMVDTTGRGNATLWMVKKHFIPEGWRIHDHKRSKDRCPACMKKTVAASLPAPDEMSTALGAALVKGAAEKLLAPAPTLAPAVGEPKVTLAAESPSTFVEDLKAAMTPDPALTPKQKMGAGPKAYHASLTPEQRSENGRRAALAKSEKMKAAKKAAQITENRRAGQRRRWERVPEELRSAVVASSMVGGPGSGTLTAKTPVAKETPMAPAPRAELRVVAAEPPPVATPDDNMRIREALDTHYGKDCYVGDMSDAKLSVELNVPPAWIANIRSMFHGPDVNEAQSVKAEVKAEVEALRTELKNIEDRLLSAIDTELRPVRARLEKAEQKLKAA